MSVEWHGITKSLTLKDEFAKEAHALADAAKCADWVRLFTLLKKFPLGLNSGRPDSKSLYAPLHQAAHAGASVEVVRRLIELGAWRTLQNARGERPLDVAVRKGHSHLFEILAPVLKRQVPSGVLLKIQQIFHEVIRGRVNDLVRENALRLPELEPLLELPSPPEPEKLAMWFVVPGMYGGFSFDLVTEGVDAKLVTESWCRIEGGSGQRHEITSAGSVLVDEGFV